MNRSAVVVRMENSRHTGGDALHALDDASLRAAAGGDARPVRIRMMGGALPTQANFTPPGLPFVIAPPVIADNNQHSFDKNLRMGSFINGMSRRRRTLR